MTGRAFVARFLFLGGIFTLGGPALAENHAADTALGRVEESMRHIRTYDRLEMVRLWWLIDELQVDDEQALELFPLWSRHKRKQEANRERQSQVRRELSRLLESAEAQDDDIVELTTDLWDLQQELFDLKQEFHTMTEDVLTVRQRARLLLFEDRFRRELRGLVREFRHLRRQRGEPGPPSQKSREEAW